MMITRIAITTCLTTSLLLALPTFYPLDVTVYPNTPIYYPMYGDKDGDGVVNSRDAFPADPSEWYDTDHDGIGNNADPDDDNDGIPDNIEIINRLNPLNPTDGGKDVDGDGFSNFLEYQLGTNIINSKSHPVWVPIIMSEIMMFFPVKP